MTVTAALARHPGLWSALCLVLPAAAVVAVNAVPGQSLALGLLTAVLLLLSIGWGRLLATLGRTALPMELHLIIGLAFLAFGLALPVMLFSASILLPAGVLLLGGLGWRLRAADETAGWPHLLCLLAVAGFALIWSLESSIRFDEFLAGGRYRLWSDGFIQAGTIAEFGEPRSAGRGSSALADVRAPFYHAVSHALAGLAVRLTGVTPLAVQTSFWLPLGSFVSALGVFALGRMMAGLAGGALCLALLILLPDAAAYGLRQGFFSFHWMMETSPGSLYALPVACASVALLVLFIRQGGLRTLALSAVLLAASFMLRAHVFVWLLVPWAVTVWLTFPGLPARWRHGLLALGCVAAVPVLLLYSRTEIASIGLVSFLARYLEFLHTGFGPTAYDGLYAWMTGRLGPLGALPFGLGLALLGIGGVFLPAVLAGLVLALRRGLMRPYDALPITALAWAAGLMTLAPTPYNGDFTDLRQRGFVVLYAVLLVWSADLALRLWPRLNRPASLAVACCLGLASMVLWLPGAKQPHMAILAPHRDNAIRPGLLAAARWIQAEATPQESFLMGGQNPDEVWFDDSTIIIGASGVPAWLSRPGVLRASGPPRTPIVAERLAIAAAVQAETNAEQALARLRAAGVGFYLTLATAPPAWDSTGQRAALRAGEVLGWRVPR